MNRRCTWLFLVLTWFFLNGISAQPIFDLNKKLGKGINMGNMFEAPSEAEWGNPFRDDYFKRIADLGFNHVRLPIRWDVASRTLQTAPYTINTTFLERIKYVIDKALGENLYIIINMHHHDALFQDPDGTKARFLSQWSQIATYFKGYDQRLIFEVMNEPNTNLTPKWNDYFKEALSEIRKSNPTRAVLMGVAPWGGLSGVPNLDIPNDDNIIITIHYYDPFNFTHQGAEWVNNSNPWLGTKWENSQLERNEIISGFAFVQQLAKQKNKPIHIGEFGAYSKADLDSRIKWSNFLARWFESQGFSWTYWEWSAGFGIFNPATNQYLTSLADALLKTPMLPVKQQTTVTVFESNFGPNDGWFLGVNSPAMANASRTNNQMLVDVTKSSTDGWHVQLVKAPIAIKNQSKYQVIVRASATVPASITCYIGKNGDPWNSYSGYKSISLTSAMTDYSYSFEMTSPTDLLARIAFDMANKESKITIASVTIQEIVESTVALSYALNDRITVYPNPAMHTLYYEGLTSPVDIRIINSIGQLVKHVPSAQKTGISVGDLKQGTYYVHFTNKEGVGVKKLMIQ